MTAAIASPTSRRTCACAATRSTPRRSRWTSRRRSSARSSRIGGAPRRRSPSGPACAGTTTTSRAAARATPDLDNVQPRRERELAGGSPHGAARRRGASRRQVAVRDLLRRHPVRARRQPDGDVPGRARARVPAGARRPRLDRVTLPPGEIRETVRARPRAADEPPALGRRPAAARRPPRRELDAVWVDTRNLPRSWDLNAQTRASAPPTPSASARAGGDAVRPVAPVTGGFRRRTTTETGGRSHVRGASFGAVRYRRQWYAAARRQLGVVAARQRHRGHQLQRDAGQPLRPRVGRRRERPATQGHRARDVDRRARPLTLAGIADFQTGTPINRIAFFRDLDGLGRHVRQRLPRQPGSLLRRAAQRGAAARCAHGECQPGVRRCRSGRLRRCELRADVFNVFNRLNAAGVANGIPAAARARRSAVPAIPSTSPPPARRARCSSPLAMALLSARSAARLARSLRASRHRAQLPRRRARAAAGRPR